MLPLLAVLSQMHYEGDVPIAGGDYAEVAIAVPTGTVEIQVAHDDGSDYDILDWGVWSPEGFRGWGGGLADDAIIGVTASSRGYLVGAITPGTWTVVIGKAKLDDGGHYTLDVTCRDVATLTPVPMAAPSALTLSTERRWYKGDFHVHSEQSGDAAGTIGEIAAFAVSRGLDFVNLSDHNTTAQVPLLDAFLATNMGVLLLHGAEVTTYAGHGNAVGTTRYIDHRIGLRGRTVVGILDDVAAQDGIFIVNHPALDLGGACIGCAWKHDDTDWSKVSGIEVLTGNWEFTVGLSTPGAIALWETQLAAGHKIAAIGGSDDHRRGQGTGATDSAIGSPTTMVLADALSEQAIIDAVRAGRTYVKLRGPEDPDVDFRLNDEEVASDVGEVANAHVTIHVRGGAGNFAQVWRDGAKQNQLAITSDDETLDYVDSSSGAHRYHVELINDINQRIVITSHSYATVVPEQGGCCQSSRSSSASFALAGLVVLRLRRRRR